MQSYEFSDSFLEHLNSNARVIQKWYRQLQANKKKSVDSIINEFASKRKPVRVKKVSKTGNQSKVLNDLKEDPIMKRRRERAESVRLEILKDIEASSSTLTLNNVDAPITDIESSSLKLDILESPVMDRESSTFTLNVIESPTLDRESSTLTLNEITSNCEIKVLKDNRNAYLTSNINASNDSEIESDIINSIDKKRVVDQTAQKNIALELNEETNFIKVDTIDDSINCDSIDENQISVEPQIEYIETRNVEIDHRKDENVSTREEIISIESQSPKVEISTPPPSRNDLKRSNTKKSSSSKSSSKNCIKKYETAPSIYSTNKTEDSNDTTSQSVDRILGFLKNVQVETPNVPKPEIVTEGFSSNVFDGVKQKIIGLQLEIEEKNHIIAAYKQEAKKLKDENKEQAIQS